MLGSTPEILWIWAPGSYIFNKLLRSFFCTLKLGIIGMCACVVMVGEEFKEGLLCKMRLKDRGLG